MLVCSITLLKHCVSMPVCGMTVLKRRLTVCRYAVYLCLYTVCQYADKQYDCP